MSQYSSALELNMAELSRLLDYNKGVYYAQFYIHGMAHGHIFDVRGGPDAEPVVSISALTLADLFNKLTTSFKEYRRGQ
jgi:hypothetical protein